MLKEKTIEKLKTACVDYNRDGGMSNDELREIGRAIRKLESLNFIQRYKAITVYGKFDKPIMEMRPDKDGAWIRRKDLI